MIQNGKSKNGKKWKERVRNSKNVQNSKQKLVLFYWGHPVYKKFYVKCLKLYSSNKMCLHQWCSSSNDFLFFVYSKAKIL